MQMMGTQTCRPPFLGGLQVKNYINSRYWKGRKLCRSVKMHGELVNFRFHFPGNRKLVIFMILGLMGISQNRLKPSVWCRGWPQVFFPPKNTDPNFLVFQISTKRQNNYKREIPCCFSVGVHPGGEAKASSVHVCVMDQTPLARRLAHVAEAAISRHCFP